MDSDSVPIPLRPLADASSEHEDMKTLIARMHKKYGGFRHVTEDMLLKEMAAGNNGYTEQDDDEAEHEKGTPEYLVEKKATVVQELGYEPSTPSAIC
jgi:Subunit 17 of Mediator complex